MKRMDLSNFVLKKMARAQADLHTRQALGLRLPAGWPDSPLPVQWRWRDEAGAEHRGQAAADLHDLPPETRRGRIFVWTPPADTLLTQASLPTRSRAKILQALPFVLEEQILGEPEQMHFAYRILADGRLAVAVTARERVEAWQAGLASAGIHAAALAPLVLALPCEEGTWFLAFQDDELWVRTGPVSGVTLPLHDTAATLAAALAEARSEDRAPEKLVIVRAPLDFAPERLAEALALPVIVREAPLHTEDAPAMNLLQDAGEMPQARAALLKLRPAVAALALLIAVGFVGSLWEWWSLSTQARAQQAQMMQLFRSAFPEAKTIVDPALQMQRNLASLRARSGIAGDADFLPLLARAAPRLRDDPQITLKGVTYADGKLTLDLSLVDFQALESLKNALAADGLRAEVEAANSRDNQVEGRLRIAVVK